MSVLKSLRDVTPYAPTDWKAGDLITASKLNNIEEGIQEALAGIVPAYEATDEGKVLTVTVVEEAPVLAWATSG